MQGVEGSAWVDTLTGRFIAVVVTVGWAASVVADIISASYSPPVEIHALMGMVIGGAIGRKAIVAALNGSLGEGSAKESP